MTDIQGSYDELFSAVPSALAGLLNDGDTGGSVAVFVDGEPVVDVWGGFADADRTVPWQQDTIVLVYSVTKTMTALCALMLADRGELDLDAPVSRYWPEFAAAGKEKVLVRHLLGHTAGLPHWDGPVEEIYDWPAATARLAATAPLWEPGTEAGYHSLTQGFLVGEVIRRITGQTVWRPRSRRQAAMRTMPPARPPPAMRLPRRAPPSGSVTGTAWRGAARRTPRWAGTATPARSPSCSR
jgi:CubicO group peptidase (beta-lactamase class C family)